MNLNFLRRIWLLSAIGATLISHVSCVDINEHLGENLIPSNQLWDVYAPEAVALDDIVLHTSDSLSAYSTRRMTFGAINDDGLGSCTKGTSITLVPIIKEIDLGEDPELIQFHFSAVRDTLSTVNDNQQRMMQNIFVYSLREALDENILYTNSLSPGVMTAGATETNENKFIDRSKYISKGIPVYNGGDSLSFDFSKEYAESVIAGLQEFYKGYTEKKDTLLSDYLKLVPGIYIESEAPSGIGGRINMFDLALEFNSSGYISGNYAELKIRTDYDTRKDVDTSFIFFFGPADFIATGSSDIPKQYAFNGSTHASEPQYAEGVAATDKIYVDGDSGVKPVIKARSIRNILNQMISNAEKDGVKMALNPDEVVINKATVILPYNVDNDWGKLEKYPTILSPTVRLRGTDDDNKKYVTYAGLTDASIESENHGDINRSLSMYSPDISHHVQEIMKLKQEEGETDADFEKRLEKYDIWMLIMHQEVTVTTSPGSGYDDYYNSLLYNSYYNNMMYDPYGYGYGYGGYGGYGYDSYGYGYGSNYYNYMMMASYMNSSSNSSESVSTDLDKDRYYNCTLNGPTCADNLSKPQLKITFSAPKTAERSK